MVSIVTNEEDVTNAMKRLKNRSQENLTKNASKNHLKKNYFQSER
jgi:ribosomal protein S21